MKYINAFDINIKMLSYQLRIAPCKDTPYDSIALQILQSNHI